jgi:hypothetical protein
LRQRPVFPPLATDPLAAPARGPRPATVTTALILQYVVAGLLLLAGGLILWEAVSYNALIDEAAGVPGASQVDASAARAENRVFGGVPAALVLLLAGWQVTSALLMRRGNNVARFLGLVGMAVPTTLGLLSLCGLGFFAVTFFAAQTSAGDPFAEGPYPEDFEGTLPDPDSYYYDDAFYARLDDLVAARDTTVVDIGLPLLIIVAIFLMITAFVLLVTPATNRWFRTPDELPRPWSPAFAGHGTPPPFPMPHHPVPPFPPQPFVSPQSPFPPQPNYAPPPPPWASPQPPFAQPQPHYAPPSPPWAQPQEQPFVPPQPQFLPYPHAQVSPRPVQPPIPPGDGPQN